MKNQLANDTLMTRAGLAKALGVTVQEVQRRLRIGSLVPHSHRGTEPMFTYGQLEEQRMLSRKRTTVGAAQGPAPVEFSGDDASIVFKALREGKALDDIVIESSVHPLIVKAASEAFAQLRGGLFLSVEHMRELEKMPIDGEWPVQSAKHLVDMLRGALEETSCEKCKKKARKVCLVCAKNLARKGKTVAEDEDEG